MSQINIDFQVLSNYNPKYLIVLDTSEWGVIKGKPSIIEIILPGFKTPVTQFLAQNQVNSFNSLNLGLNCQGCIVVDKELHDLPDGIYTITIKGSPSTYQFTRLFLKTDTLRLNLDTIYMKYSDGSSVCSKETLKKIQEIEFLIKAAEANMRLSNLCETRELMFRAEKLINKLKSCKTCV